MLGKSMLWRRKEKGGGGQKLNFCLLCLFSTTRAYRSLSVLSLLWARGLLPKVQSVICSVGIFALCIVQRSMYPGAVRTSFC